MFFPNLYQLINYLNLLMENTSFKKLFELVKKQPHRRLVVANGVDIHSLEAVAHAFHEGIVSVILTGDEKEIRKNCKLKGLMPDNSQIIHCDTDEDAIKTAVRLVNDGEADLIMKGLVSTDQYMRYILDKKIGLLPEGALLTHVSMIKIPNYHKPLFVGDVAIIPQPNIDQKKQIVKYLAYAARLFGVAVPKVAFLAATEKVSPKMQACTDAYGLKKMWEQGDFPDTICDGPMALDLAVDKKSAIIKNFNSQVAGDADCLLFPNIEAGNVFYKTVSKFCDPEIAAIVVGTSVPTILSSRGDTMQTKLNSIALAALMG
jgi:phosphotransacetylase